MGHIVMSLTWTNFDIEGYKGFQWSQVQYYKKQYMLHTCYLDQLLDERYMLSVDPSSKF